MNSENDSPTLIDNDRDAMHILPLACLNIETRALREVRLIKNNQIRTVVELFHGDAVGSGQMEIEHLHSEFNWNTSDPPKDLILLRRLAPLKSFDVYSLRISLREMGVDLKDISALQLSDKKKAELTAYMKGFTEPLIKKIYGDENLKIDSFDDVIGLFSDPDVAKVKARLEAMAKELHIGLMDVPHFLEDFGDVFLSLSYYRACMDQIEPIVEEFSDSIEDLKKSYQFKNNAHLMQTCDTVERTLTGLLTAIGGRLETFERNTEDMWKNLSADKFNQVKQHIQSYHTIIGGSLCALTVKMDAWKHQFPDRNIGGPTRRSEFIMSEMKAGMERLREIQAAS